MSFERNTNLVKHFERNTRGRDFAVGDIHGHFEKVTKALIDVQFDGRNDRLFSTGDLVDRGPQSKEVLEWLARPWFHPILGNHEQMAIDWVDGLMKDPDVYIRNGGEWFLSLGKAQQVAYANAFERLPLVQDIDTENGLMGMVHADCPFLTWVELVVAVQNNPGNAGLIEHILWSRKRFDDRDATPVEGVNHVLVGHTPVEEVGHIGNHLYMDTGMWRNTLEPREADLVQLSGK